MHVTLHYLGEADVEATATALETVAVSSFRIELEGVGRFISPNQITTLWVGVRKSAELQVLHTAIATALAGSGFRPESRDYTPHITLARCESTAPAEVTHDFLARNQKFSLPELPATAFGLFSSTFVGDTPVYRRERTIPLLRT
jgi:2'-5' RNA ligase